MEQDRQAFKQAFQIQKSTEEVCLLIHGFCGNPAEMRPLAQDLAARGYSVSAVCLAGHGTRLEEMNTTPCTAWIDTVTAEFLRLRGSYRRVHVIGQSMGSLLAFYLAEHYNPDTITALCVPLRFANRSFHAAEVIRHFKRYQEWEPLNLPGETLPYLCGYNKMPWAGMAQLIRLSRAVERDLFKVKQPVLFVYGVHDTLIDHAGVALARGAISSKVKELLVLPGSGHLLTLDVDRMQMFRQIARFIDTH